MQDFLDERRSPMGKIGESSARKLRSVKPTARGWGNGGSAFQKGRTRTRGIQLVYSLQHGSSRSRWEVQRCIAGKRGRSSSRKGNDLKRTIIKNLAGALTNLPFGPSDKQTNETRVRGLVYRS